MPTGPKPVCSNVDSILNRPSVHSKLHIRRAKSLKKRISNPLKSEKAPAVIVHSYVTISIEFILKVPITFLPFSCRIINTDYELKYNKDSCTTDAPRINQFHPNIVGTVHGYGVRTYRDFF